MKRMSSSLRAKEEFMMMCREGIYQAGERLPSETKMAQQFGISRETWRASLELLRREGIIYSKHGVGTFLMEISTQTENDLTRLNSISEMIRQAGIPEGRSSYTTGLTIPSQEVASALNIKHGINVFYVNRTRYTKNGEPICCSMHYMPVYLADELDPMHMPDSLFSYFERRKGIFVSRSSARVIIPTEDDPLAMQLRNGGTMQILGMEQQHFDSRGNSVLYTVDYLRSEIFNFSITRIREK